MTNPKRTSRIPLRRRLLFALITVLFSSAIGLACVEWALRVQKQRIAQSDDLQQGMIIHDPRLGWRLKPDFVASHHHYDFDATYTINRHGFRGEFPQSANEAPAPEGVTRYAVVGDSFTFGIGVDDDQTFVHLLNKKLCERGEFLNFSIPAFSTDQQYLLVTERVKQFTPDVILLVVYLGNDLVDNELDFPLQADNAKPYFKLVADGQLQRRNFPVPMERKPPAAQRRNLATLLLGEDAEPSFPASLRKLELVRRLGLFQDQRQLSDQFFEQRLASALRLFRALLDAIAETAEKEGAELKIVVLSGKSFLDAAPSVSKQYQDFLRRRIVAELGNDVKIEVIDAAATMRDRRPGKGEHWNFPHEGHLTPEGHRAVAAILADRL